VLPVRLSPDGVEFGERSFEFLIKEPHRFEDFGEGHIVFSPVGFFA
jgi:hypothetical protein